MRRVVITGMGVVSPIGSGVQDFFAGLREARPGIDRIATFDASSFRTSIAGEVRGLAPDRVELPEPESAALRRDRKSIFGLVAGREALAYAFAGDRPTVHYPAPRIGMMVSTGLEIFNLGDLLPYVRSGVVHAREVLDNIAEAPPHSRLQIPSHLGARCLLRETGAEGPFSVNLSACAAGTQALGEAFRAIREGVVDAAVTGGYDSMINPLGVGGFTLLKALSTSNELRGAASRPFDRNRDGFVLGEGAAMFVLEEATAAERRGASVHAEIFGYASRLDAYRVTDPHPEQVGTTAVMAAALGDGQLQPGEVDYINAHGTATRQNDPAEAAAIRAVFGPAADQLPVSSTKSQIGHLIGAAGAVEAMACLFALKESMVPATINLTDPDPECDLDHVAGTPRRATVGTVLSNSFGFGGQNASIVLGTPRE